MKRRLLIAVLIAAVGTAFAVPAERALATTVAPSASTGASVTSEALKKQQQALEQEARKLEDAKKQAERERANAQTGLADANESIREITGERQIVSEAISDLNDDLVSLIATISMIEEQIEDTRVQIADTQVAYDEAKQKEEEQYAAMKARAKFMYEKGDQDMLYLLLQCESISEFLNRTTYVQELYDYDRKELETFIRTKEEAEALGEQLAEEEAELKADLYELEQSQADMEQILEELKQQAEDYDLMLAHAKQDAAAYQMKIKQQASAIDELAKQIQAKAAEEEAVKKAAEEAKVREDAEKKRLEEEKKKTQTGASAGASGSTAGTGTSAATGNTNTSTQSQSSASSEGSNAESSSQGKTYAAPGAATGANIAAYACQFIGNPYVAGGTSLTNGCDCSGFVMAVYRDFGISVPRTSWSLQSVGREVSLEDAQPGDIVCYAGHVGIYTGGGQIVHASTERTGIKYGNVNYKTIITIRRVV